MIMKFIKRVAFSILFPAFQKSIFAMEQSILRSEYVEIRSNLLAKMPGNPACHGYKIFSQGDEDGIISEIVRRIESESTLKNYVFVEIGAGTTGENNSSLLLMQGWRGVMVDADSRIVDYFKDDLTENLIVLNERVEPDSKLENIVSSLQDRFGVTPENSKVPIGILSLDIDGIDGEVLTNALQVIEPEVLVLEYNAAFPPPHLASLNPKINSSWRGDNYYGMSLQSWYNLIGLDYTLVACGLTGVNSFWVKNRHANIFEHYPIAEVYQPARYHLTKLKWGHEPSASKWIKN